MFPLGRFGGREAFTQHRVLDPASRELEVRQQRHKALTGVQPPGPAVGKLQRRQRCCALRRLAQQLPYQLPSDPPSLELRQDMEFDDLQAVAEPDRGVLGSQRVADNVMPPLALLPGQGIHEADQAVVWQQRRHRS